MATHDYVIANGTGAAVRSDLNGALAAIVSQNSSATEPSPSYAYQRWADTTAGVMKMRNGANNAWISLYQLDGEWTSIAFENGTAAAPSIYFKDSGTDTGIYSPGADQVAISTGGTGRITIDGSGNVNIDSNTLYVDATNNRVGVGTTSPGHLLDVNGDTAVGVGAATGNNYNFRVRAGTSGLSRFIAADTSDAGYIDYDHSSDAWIFRTAGSEAARIDSSRRLLVGTASASSSANQIEVVTAAGLVGFATFSISETALRSSYAAYAGLQLASYQSDSGSPYTKNVDIVANSDGTVPSQMRFLTKTDGAASPTERMRINSSGAFKASSNGSYTGATSAYHEFYQTTNVIGLFIRGTNASQTSSILEINGDRTTTNASYNLIDAYNGNVSGRFSVRDSGNAVNTNNSYGAISDVKLKENIVDAGSQWADIKAFRVRKYNFKEGQKHTQIGGIAQEVELISPGLVTESPDRDAEGNDLGTVTKSINYSVLYMKAVKALQEAMERIETLEARLTALEGA